MSQWKNDDSAANSPNWAPATVDLTNNTANRAALFGNNTADAFVTGQTVGVYGVDSTESQWVQYKALGATAGSNVGSGVILTSNATTGYQVNGGTASVNAVIKVASLSVGAATINAAGSGYATGDTVTISGSGTGAQAKFAVTANATGNVTAITKLAGAIGSYTVFPSATANTSNTTGAGTGLRLNVLAGIGDLVVNVAGTFTALPTASGDNIATAQADQTGTGAKINFVFSKSNTQETHAGWVKVTDGSGGRAGRRTTEVLVASGSLTGDAEDTLFPNT